MHAITQPDEEYESEPAEQRVVLNGLTWADFVRIVKARGESNRVRFAFDRGSLEIMSPGLPHESIKKRLARLVEAWSDAHGLELFGIGSWLLKHGRKKRAIEPDECYALDNEDPVRPDLAIEVALTSGGLSKLAIYKAFEVPEVWIWRKGRLEFHWLVDGEYVEAARSLLFPDLDPTLLAECMAVPSQLQAVRLLRARIADAGA